jgi:hypothetical protein
MAQTEQQRKAHVAGLLGEKRAYEAQVGIFTEALEAAEDDPVKAVEAKKAKDTAEANLAAVDEQLGFYGHKAAAPAKRAEKRPARKPESRA